MTIVIPQYALDDPLTKFREAFAACMAAASLHDLGALVWALSNVKSRSARLFILGVGGSAANASHAVNDFRKLCGIEAYAPTDNVAEITARTNDEGWRTVFSAWLKTSRLSSRDAILILSVGGGNVEHGISLNLVDAIDYAKSVGTTVLGIVGRDGGYTKAKGDHVIVASAGSGDMVTPITESFQSVVLHALVSHPFLAVQKAKWEATAPSVGAIIGKQAAKNVFVANDRVWWGNRGVKGFVVSTDGNVAVIVRDDTLGEWLVPFSELTNI